MKYVIYNLSDSTESKPISNQKQKLASFKKGIKREETAYPTLNDTIYIKTQVFRLLRYDSPAPRKIAKSDWSTQNITHNLKSSLKQPYGVHSH